MSVTEERWSRCHWTFSYRPFYKGSSIFSLILCIGVWLGPDFGPLCFLLSTFSPDVFHLCFSCHAAMTLNLRHWALTSLPPLSWHYPRGPPPPRPALQTHFFPEMNMFSSQIPVLHLLLTPRPLTLFPPFLSLLQRITCSFLLFPSPHFPLEDQDLTQHAVTPLKL